MGKYTDCDGTSLNLALLGADLVTLGVLTADFRRLWMRLAFCAGDTN
jgi:hypothetical protein